MRTRPSAPPCGEGELGIESVAVDRRPTIMLADDDPEVLTTSADALTEAGFRVLKYGDGQAVLQEALDKRRVDLIILDISMPQVGGVEACHCLKAMPRTRKIPVVLTAHKKDPAAKTLGERMHGSVKVLRKPFTPEELVAAVRDLVRPKSLIL
jgi:CheY-like chemotaxis protein